MGDSAILVTGATGFVGGHMLDLLRRDGSPVVAWHRPGRSPAFTDASAFAEASADRPPPLVELRRNLAEALAKAGRSLGGGRSAGKPTAPQGDVRWQAVDLLDRQAVHTAIGALRPAAIYHLAGAAHEGRSWHDTTDTLAINVLGTHHLLDAIRAARLRARVLIPGSALVYSPSTEAISEDHRIGPSSPYAVSKLAQEMLGVRAVAEEGAETLLARSFNHVGPRQDPSFAASGFARQIAAIEAGLAPPFISVGNLDTRRDLTDVRDTVRAYRLMIERGTPGRFYNVCSGRAYLIRQLLDHLVANARVQVEVRTDPTRLRPSDNPVLLGNPQRIRDELGWSAEIPIDRTLSDLLAYWRLQTRNKERETRN